MANDTPVNSQITDEVTQAASTLLGSDGATTVSHTRQLASQALALLMENATAAQHHGQTIADAVVAAGVRLINDTDETSGKQSK